MDAKTYYGSMNHAGCCDFYQNKIITFDKFRLAPYNNSGINDCAVCERGSPHTAQIMNSCTMT